MDNDKTEAMYQVEKLIQIMRENSTKKVHIETKDWKISIEQNENSQMEIVKAALSSEDSSKDNASGQNRNDLHIVTTPLVGTFYRASSPEQEPYVEIGDVVEIGQVLCLVEAMKVMNEIHSDIEGVVTKIVAANGDMVEYGQPLFEIKPQDSNDEA
jgi:acetyl-CoA carboxylase biotin carboxyl carrier protein